MGAFYCPIFYIQRFIKKLLCSEKRERKMRQKCIMNIKYKMNNRVRAKNYQGKFFIFFAIFNNEVIMLNSLNYKSYVGLKNCIFLKIP